MTWTYEVTNTSTVDLTDVMVVDSEAGAATCSSTALAAGASMTCGDRNGRGGLVSQRGDGHRYGTGHRQQGDRRRCEPVCGAASGDRGDQADQRCRHRCCRWHPNRVDVPTAATTDVTFDVSNVGTAPLRDITVTDLPADADVKPLTVTCPATTLAVGAHMTCTASGTALLGEHDDTATATGSGTFTNGEPLSHPDGSPVPPVTDSSTAGYRASPRRHPPPARPPPPARRRHRA